MPTLSVTACSWISRPMIRRVSPNGIDAKAARPKNTDTNGASLNMSRSACAGVKSSLVSILTASASGWSRPRIRMPKIDARLAPMRSCMIADCLRSTQVSRPPKFSTTNMTKPTGMACSSRSSARPLMPGPSALRDQARIREAAIGHPGEGLQLPGPAIEHLLGARGHEGRLGAAQRAAQTAQALPVGHRVAQRLHHGAEPLHAALEVREGAFPLDVGRAGQDEVRARAGGVGVGPLEHDHLRSAEGSGHVR